MKNIAEVHWEINDLTDKYVEARDQWQLDMARDLKNTCSQSREKAHSAFQKFLTDELVVGTVKYTRPGVHLKEVKGEYIFFIIEVAEKGKYIHAWCHRARGGDDLYIKGRNIRSSR